MRSDCKTNGSGGAEGAAGQLPASVKKMVQNLKEIVNNNCTNSEIYAVLRDCNMDPDDAVQRLLSQDTFHEVKSRRERRKEMKETQEPKTHSKDGISNRGVRGGSEHSFRQSGSMLINSIEHGKPAYKKENGSDAFIPATSTLHATGQPWNDQPPSPRSSFNSDNRRQSIRTSDMIDSFLQPSRGSQSTWAGPTLGQVTMADIVRMGKPRSKGSQMPCETSCTPQDDVPPTSAIYQMKPSVATSSSQLGTHLNLHSSDLNPTRDSGKKYSLHDFDDEWPVNEPIRASSDIGATMYSNQSYLNSNIANLSSNCWSENILVSESNAAGENFSSDHVNSARVSGKQIFMNDSGGASQHDNDLCKDTSSPDSYQQIYKHQEGVGRGSNVSVPNSTSSDDAIKAVSSAALNLQQLSLGMEERLVIPMEDNQAVVLPNYLLAFSADCSHLSFGTYKSGKNTELPHPQESRNSVYRDKEQLEFDFDTNRATSDARNCSSLKFSQMGLSKLDIPDAAARGNDYFTHSSIPGSSFKNTQQLSSGLSFVIDLNARNIPFPSEVQSHWNSIPSDLLAVTIQSIKARDYVAILASHSISFGNSSYASAIKNPTASMSEILKSGAFSVSHPSSQAWHGANLATGSALKEHLLSHSYSQNGYPTIPQGHGYIPSALQQGYVDSNLSHGFHGGMYNLPHYKRASMSSFPLSSSSTSGYQSLGNSADIPEGLLHNLFFSPASSKVGYDDILRTQYWDGGANFNLLQRNDGSGRWDYGHGLPTVSTTPNSACFSMQGQNHQVAGYQQGQQLHGALGYLGV